MPLLVHLIQTDVGVFACHPQVEGIATIRALGWQGKMASRTTKNLDISQRTAYMVMCLKRWLTLILGLSEAGITIMIVAMATYLRAQITGAEVGLLFSVVLDTATALRLLLEAWTTLDVALGAVDRLQSATLSTPREHNKASTLLQPQPGPWWPQAGHVTIRDLTCSYSDTIALNTVNLDLAAGQKIHVCGRTGR
jgi:ATP-binding cassette, subfamily C (CFTR/MRP), member 1